MVLPLVPLALLGASVVTGTGGTALGLKGFRGIKRANDTIKSSGERYEAERSLLEAQMLRTNETLAALGAQQTDAFHSVVDRLADFFRRNEKLVATQEKLIADGLDATLEQVAIDAGLGIDAAH